MNKTVLRRSLGKDLRLHSDRSIQYASKDFKECVIKHDFVQNMSREDNCWDNAVAEAFFASTKTQLIPHTCLNTNEGTEIVEVKRPCFAMTVSMVEVLLRLQDAAIRLCAKIERIHLISSITNQGTVRFLVYQDAMNSQTLIKFLKRLIKGADNKVFLILDNLRVHHSNLVKEWLENHQEGIELFFLPSYLPELNPEEYLNCNLKAGVHSGSPARSKSDLKKKVISHLKMRKKNRQGWRSISNIPKYDTRPDFYF